MNLKDFDTELNQKLQNITHNKSTKKIKHFFTNDELIHNIYTQSPPSNSYAIKPIELKGQFSNKKVKQSHLEDKLNTLQDILIKQQSEMEGIFSIVGDKQLSYFLQDSFGRDCKKLDLSMFLAKCLAAFSVENICQEQIKQIFFELQEEITTTDSNTVSLNALQLTLRKKDQSLKLFIKDKIQRAEYKVQRAKLAQSTKLFQTQISNKQNKLQNRQKLLKQQENSHIIKQKDLSKRDKALALKQKQLPDRFKYIIQALKEKAATLQRQFLAQINQAGETIDKKISTCQRNMKYKIQNLNKKAMEIKKLREFKEHQIKITITREVQTIIDKAYSSKFKKCENQLKQEIQKNRILQNQLKELQGENNNFAKIVSKLETKLSKKQQKHQIINNQLTELKTSLKNTITLYEQKQSQNEELIHKLAQLKGNKEVQKGKQQKKSKNTIQPKPSTNTTLSVKQVVREYEQLLKQKSERLSISLKEGNRDLQLAIRLIVEERIDCLKLIQILYSRVVSHPPTQIRNSQQELYYFQHFSVFLNNLSGQQNEGLLISTFKLCFLVLLNSQNTKNCLYWLKKLSILCENQIINLYAENECQKSDKNFMHCLLCWLNVNYDELDIKIMGVYSDLALQLRIKYEQSKQNINGACKWFVFQFMRHIDQTEINKNQSEWEDLERVSILVQRLVVNNGIQIITTSDSIFKQAIIQKKGTMLQKNLNSILQTIKLNKKIRKKEREILSRSPQ